MHTEPVKNLSGPHQVFAEGIAKGLNQTEAYLAAYPGSKPAAARANAARLIAKDSITAEIDNIRRKAEAIAGSAVLTVAEVHDFLSRLVRASVTTTPADSDLWNSVKTTEFGHEFKLPCKLAAIARWADLKGEGAEAGANEALSGLLGRIRK